MKGKDPLVMSCRVVIVVIMVEPQDAKIHTQIYPHTHALTVSTGQGKNVFAKGTWVGGKQNLNKGGG